MGLFGKTQERPPKELVNEWSLKIRKEMRVVDRQIRDIQREEEKVKRSVKDAAKKGQKDVCVVLAKEMIRSRKAVSKLYASKAHMNSVLMGMKNQLAVLRVAGSLQKSTEVMKAMQSLVKIPEIQATMRELSKEMMKAGIIEEMLEDTFESMDDQEEMEEAAEMEIDKILFEITAGALGKAPSKVTDALPEPEPPGATAASEDEEEEEEEEQQQQPCWARKTKFTLSCSFKTTAGQGGRGDARSLALEPGPRSTAPARRGHSTRAHCPW
uniref:Putative vacuolar sorting protein vps24 n=1 Tax=Desmodus rotundus TaxID=9430 RepID=K9IIK8_DESRO